MENKFHMVDFELYCPQCKYYDRSEVKDPCNECLEMGANIHTSEPIKFEPKKKERRKKNGE